MKRLIFLFCLAAILCGGCSLSNLPENHATTVQNGVQEVLAQRMSEELTPEVTEMPVTEHPAGLTENAPEPLVLLEPFAAIPASDVDVDMTKMSSTMIYAQVFSMVTHPDEYLGKKIKITGNFSFTLDPFSGNTYYFCVIPDATACCQQGLEFILDAGNYPAEGEQFTIVGTYEAYKEGNFTYYHLAHAERL